MRPIGMKFSLWTNYGALNSKPVLDAFASSLCDQNHIVSYNNIDSDVDVIWSVLWHGRMAPNKEIFYRAREKNKPVVVVEVGSIHRNITWKVGLNGINKSSLVYPTGNSAYRASTLGLNLQDWKNNTNGHILICLQHNKSLQWENMPTLEKWVVDVISNIRQHTDRDIVVRPHPRCPISKLEHNFKNVQLQIPQRINGTYDDFDASYDNAYAVVNWSSNPAIEAVRRGIPVFVGPNSIAATVGNLNLETINTPSQPDRQQWLNDLAHTEYTVEEISRGIPLNFLTKYL